MLSTSGHIASMVNPPGNPKASFQTAAANPEEAADFLDEAHTVEGTWWTDYVEWLAARTGAERNKPRKQGSAAYPVVCAAPGTYVHDS